MVKIEVCDICEEEEVIQDCKLCKKSFCGSYECWDENHECVQDLIENFNKENLIQRS